MYLERMATVGKQVLNLPAGSELRKKAASGGAVAKCSHFWTVLMPTKKKSAVKVGIYKRGPGLPELLAQAWGEYEFEDSLGRVDNKPDSRLDEPADRPASDSHTGDPNH